MSKKKERLQKYNIMTLGNTAVGKTTFIIRFTDNTFKSIYLTTLGVDYKSKIITLDNKKRYTIHFFDTAGQEKYKSLALNVIKNAHGVILMYDVTNKKSFEAISTWMKNIMDLKGKEFPVILVGNKIDLVDVREVSIEDGENSAKQYGIPFFEISNKLGTNVEDAGLELINLVVDTYSNTKDDKSKGSALKLNKKNNKNNKNKGKKGCNC